MSPVVIYLLLCLLIGVLGRDRPFGLWGGFFVSLLLTPLAGALLLLLTAPARSSSQCSR